MKCKEIVVCFFLADVCSWRLTADATGVIDKPKVIFRPLRVLGRLGVGESLFTDLQLLSL